MTPPGSACSITFGIGITDARAGLRAAACTWSSPTSRRRAPSSSGAASTVSDVRHIDAERLGQPGRGPGARRLRLLRRLRRPRRQHLGAPGGPARRQDRVTRGRAGVRRAAPSATAASCTSTATACSRRSTRPRTPCRRRSCAPGAAATASTAARCSARGCTASPRTSAWTCCGAELAAGDRARLVRRGAVAAAVPGPAARRGRAERRAARRGRGRARDDRAGVPRRAAGAAAAPARGADRARRARLAGQRDGGAARDSVAAANSALQRARATMQAAPAARGARSGRRAEPSAEERGAARALHRRPRALRRRRPRSRSPREDIRITMPPYPMLLRRPRRGSRRCSSAPSAPTATATGGCCRRGQPDAGGRELPAPAGRHARSGRSSSTCCASGTAPSPRSRRSATSLFPAFGLPATL